MSDKKVVFQIKYIRMISEGHLTLWGLRGLWGPGEVLTCPDICVFSSILKTLMAKVWLYFIQHKVGYNNMLAAWME